MRKKCRKRNALLCTPQQSKQCSVHVLYQNSADQIIFTVHLLNPGPPRQWTIRRQNWNNRFQHFQIQPIKCPVQNNEISTCSLTSMFTRLWCQLNDKLKPVVLSCAYSFRNNYMLHSVYFRSLVDLENKNCVRVPLVNICRQSAWCRVWIFLRLKKSPSNALWKLFERNCSQTIWWAFLDCRNNSDSPRGTQAI